MGSINPSNPAPPAPPSDSQDNHNNPILTGEEDLPLPYWQVNIPPSLRDPQCPPFLLNISPKDRGIISTPDSQFRRLSWPEVRQLVATNRIDRFQRVPSELRRYLAYNAKLREEWGSIMNFVLGQRLRWDEPVVAKGAPFEEEGEEEEEGKGKGKGKGKDDGADIRVLRNDWPYGIDERIVHLVVWTKFDLAEDPETGDLTGEARAQIDGWVRRKFGERVGEEDYIWFKNWRSLKSVHAVEHFHVMLFDPDMGFVDEITGGDVPLVEKS